MSISRGGDWNQAFEAALERVRKAGIEVTPAIRAEVQKALREQMENERFAERLAQKEQMDKKRAEPARPEGYPQEEWDVAVGISEKMSVDEAFRRAYDRLTHDAVQKGKVVEIGWLNAGTTGEKLYIMLAQRQPSTATVGPAEGDLADQVTLAFDVEPALPGVDAVYRGAQPQPELDDRQALRTSEPPEIHRRRGFRRRSS